MDDSFGSIHTFVLKDPSITLQLPVSRDCSRKRGMMVQKFGQMYTIITWEVMFEKIKTLDCSEFHNRKWLLKDRWHVALSLFHQVQLWATEVSSNHSPRIQLSSGSWGAHPWDCQPLRDGLRKEGEGGAAQERQVHWTEISKASRTRTEVEGALENHILYPWMSCPVRNSASGHGQAATSEALFHGCYFPSL